MTSEEKPRRAQPSQPANNDDKSRQPIPVMVVNQPEEDDDNHQTSAGRIALFIFLGTLLGSILGAVADLGEAAQTFDQLKQVFDPPLTLCVVGSDTILGYDLQMAQQWAEEFEAQNEVRVKIEAIGSVNGVNRAAEGGCAHVLAMSEAMSIEQFYQLRDAGVGVECAAEIGYDIIAFVTDINNPLASLLRRDLSSVLTGGVKNWSEINGTDQPIFILARQGSGTTLHVFNEVIRHTDSFNFPPDANYVACDSNEACLNLTLGTPGSLYWVSTAWMRTQPPRYLRVLPILRNDEAPINPLHDTFELSEYPRELARPLYMYVLTGGNTSASDSEMARDFLAYVRSLNGQEVLESVGFITYFDGSAEIDLDLPPGFEEGSGIRNICGASS